MLESGLDLIGMGAKQALRWSKINDKLVSRNNWKCPSNFLLSDKEHSSSLNHYCVYWHRGCCVKVATPPPAPTLPTFSSLTNLPHRPVNSIGRLCRIYYWFITKSIQRCCPRCSGWTVLHSTVYTIHTPEPIAREVFHINRWRPPESI